MSTKALTKPLTGQQIADAGLDGWALLVCYGQGGLQTRIHTESFAAGRQIVDAIGQAAEQMHHHAESTSASPGSTSG